MSHSITPLLDLRGTLNEVEFRVLGHFQECKTDENKTDVASRLATLFPPECFTAFIFKPINFNWNAIHMFLIHLHLFHQIVLQETSDVSQVSFPSSKIGHVLSMEVNICHLKHHEWMRKIDWNKFKESKWYFRNIWNQCSPRMDLVSHKVSLGVTISKRIQNRRNYDSDPLIPILMFSA